MWAKVQLDHYVFKTKMDEARYRQLRQAVPSLPEEQPIKDFFYEDHTANCTLLMRLGFEFTVKSSLGDLSALQDVTATLERIEAKLLDYSQGQQFNAKCNVHVPNNALMQIKEVEVHEDLCTDKLNSMLQDGWRILAVCPQPDQRRPDYILGRNGPFA